MGAIAVRPAQSPEGLAVKARASVYLRDYSACPGGADNLEDRLWRSLAADVLQMADDAHAACGVIRLKGYIPGARDLFACSGFPIP
jgi:hypothetical protein